MYYTYSLVLKEQKRRITALTEAAVLSGRKHGVKLGGHFSIIMLPWPLAALQHHGNIHIADCVSQICSNQ